MELPLLLTRYQLAQLLGVSRYHSAVTKAQPVAELVFGGESVPLFSIPDDNEKQESK